MRADEDAHAQLRPADLLADAAVLSVVETHAAILNGNLLTWMIVMEQTQLFPLKIKYRIG